MPPILQQIGGAWIFYTSLPLPAHWSLDIDRVARWAPVMGVLIGLLLSLIDQGLASAHMPVQPRSALIIALWIGLTGGLHLDGAMDTADGLAVADPDRRLTVMTDSRSGAFGVMVAVIVISLKICALIALTHHRVLGLVLTTTWGRWAQVLAITHYPYLKPTGKGALHQHHWHSPQDFIPSILVFIGLGISQYALQLDWQTIIGITLISSLITWGTGRWFDRQLGGMTGDVYGAVVEWSEALLLCCLATLLTLGPFPFT